MQKKPILGPSAELPEGHNKEPILGKRKCVVHQHMRTAFPFPIAFHIWKTHSNAFPLTHTRAHTHSPARCSRTPCQSCEIHNHHFTRLTKQNVQKNQTETITNFVCLTHLQIHKAHPQHIWDIWTQWCNSKRWIKYNEKKSLFATHKLARTQPSDHTNNQWTLIHSFDANVLTQTNWQHHDWCPPTVETVLLKLFSTLLLNKIWFAWPHHCAIKNDKRTK